MERFRITRLEVNEIGPFGHLVLDFPDKPAGMEDKAEVHILTGENGTGKTTVLEMLISAVGFNQTLASKFKSKKNTSKFTISFFNPYKAAINPNTVETFSYSQSPGGVSGYDSTQWLSEFRGRNPLKYALVGYSGYRKMEHATVEGISEIISDPMDGAADFNYPGDSHLVLQWILNLKTKAAISITQNKPELALHYQQAIQTVEQSIEKVLGKPIHFVVETEPYDVKVEMDGVILNFNLLPDGLKSIISWMADFLMRMERVKWAADVPILQRNFILFLDEIEVHMHPAWQRKILPAVQSLFPNAQIFISTHSPFVVNSVDGAWIHRFVKSNGDSKLGGEPILSEDGKSISLVLEEIFNVPERFGVGAQQQLKEFYHHRDEILKGANGQTAESMLRLAKDIALQSDELRLIMEMELRQINRRKQLTLTLD